MEINQNFMFVHIRYICTCKLLFLFYNEGSILLLKNSGEFHVQQSPHLPLMKYTFIDQYKVYNIYFPAPVENTLSKLSFCWKTYQIEIFRLVPAQFILKIDRITLTIRVSTLHHSPLCSRNNITLRTVKCRILTRIPVYFYKSSLPFPGCLGLTWLCNNG